MDIPAVQNYITGRATEAITRRLGSRISIGHIELGLFSRLRLGDLYVEDFEGDTLLYARNVDGYVTGYGLMGSGRITLRHATAEGVRLNLRETPSGELNIKQLINAIADPNRERKGNFKLRMRHVTVRDMALVIERRRHRNPEYGVDFGNIRIDSLGARVSDFTIDGRNITTHIDELAARERSGFEVKRLSGRFALGDGSINFRNTQIFTAKSLIRIPNITLTGDSWADYKEFLGRVHISGQLRDTRLASDDVAFFAPKLRDWHIDLNRMNANITGEVDNMNISGLSTRIGEGTSLEATARITDLPRIERTHFDIKVSSLRSSAYPAQQLVAAVAKKGLSNGMVQMVSRAGDIDVKASFRGTAGDFESNLTAVMSAAGTVDCNVSMQDHRRIEGSLTTRNLNLGRLAGNTELLGGAAVSARVSGNIGGAHDLNWSGDVARLELNGYSYDTIRMHGNLRNRVLRVDNIETDDPNLKLDMVGFINFADSIPSYLLQMNLYKADLAALKVNRRDSVSDLRGEMTVSMRGKHVDNLNGNVKASNIVYRYNNDTVATTQPLEIASNSVAGVREVRVDSEYATLSLKTQSRYKTIFDRVRYSLCHYFPLLSRKPIERPADDELVIVRNNRLILNARTLNIAPIANAIAPDFDVADGSRLQLIFDPLSYDVDLEVNSKYVERGNLSADTLYLHLDCRGLDTLTLSGSVRDLYLTSGNAFHFQRVRLEGGAREGDIELATSFVNNHNNASGRVALRAEHRRDTVVYDVDEPQRSSEDKEPERRLRRLLDLRVMPSNYTAGDKRWEMTSDNIAVDLDTLRIDIGELAVSHGAQRMVIDGVASRSRDDSVTLRLTNFDMSPFTRITETIGYSIEGRTNGMASVKSLLKESEIFTDINLDDVAVNGLSAPPMRLRAVWDAPQNLALVGITNRRNDELLVVGLYRPSDRSYKADIKVDSLELSLLDPLLKGVIHSTAGYATTEELRLSGGGGRPMLMKGRLRVDSLATTIGYTNVPYIVPSATVEVVNSQLKTTGADIFDMEGNSGKFDFMVDLSKFSNIPYAMTIRPRNMLVLDTEAADNERFYGHVYASGEAKVVGSKGKVRLDISAANGANSSFVMPITEKSSIARADFVTFEKPVTKVLDARQQRRLEAVEKQKTATGRVDMTINMNLNVTPDLDFEIIVAGDPIRAKGTGNLTLDIRPRDDIFTMNGTYDIREGEYRFSLQNVITKPFKIQEGSSIQWLNSPMDPTVNITASYTVQNASLQPILQNNMSTDGSVSSAETKMPVECLIHLSEQLTSPAIKLDVRVPEADSETQMSVANVLNTEEEVNKQFLYLLVMNSFYSDSAGDPLSNIGSTLSAGTSLELLSGMLSNLISTSDYNVMLRYRPQSDMTNEEVDFGVSVNLAKNRLLIEVDGNYIIENRQAINSSMSNFMGEANITYLVNRAGTLKAKAFTQTIDRFDENQGQQETGVGLSFGEDFNNFSNLRERLKERFDNKRREERKARREERKEAKHEAATAVTDSE